MQNYKCYSLWSSWNLLPAEALAVQSLPSFKKINISCNINFCNCPFPGYILELALLFMYASVCNNTGIVIEKNYTLSRKKKKRF